MVCLPESREFLLLRHPQTFPLLGFQKTNSEVVLQANLNLKRKQNPTIKLSRITTFQRKGLPFIPKLVFVIHPVEPCGAKAQFCPRKRISICFNQLFIRGGEV